MKEGFTLIETLIVIAVTAILSTIFIAYSNSSNGQLPLYTSQAQVIGVLQHAKSLALDKYTTGPGGTTTCAFGVNFSTSTGAYFIYAAATTSATCTGMTDYTWGGSASNYQIQALQLDSRLVFASSTPKDLYFVPPYFVDDATGTVLIVNKQNGTAAAIEVDAGGSISAVPAP